MWLRGLITATAADVGAPIEIFLSSLNNGQDFTYWAMSG